MLNKRPLTGYPEGSNVEGWALIQVSRILTSSKSNKKYIRWEGLDADARPAKGTLFPPLNDQSFAFPKLVPGDVVSVTGTIGEGRTGMDVWATSIVRVSDPKDIEDFKSICYPHVPQKELDKYIKDLKAYASSFQDPSLNEVSKYLFEYFAEYLPYAPAARSNHEPFRGGLAKHTWEIVTFLNSQLLLDKGLCRDVLLFSAEYHDIGKVREYTSQMTWSPSGRLISHTATAIELITGITINNHIALDESLWMQIEHCLISHHGKDVGPAPATREAIALHFADNMLAQLGHIDECVRRGEIGSDGWGRYSNWLNTAPYVSELDDRLNK